MCSPEHTEIKQADGALRCLECPEGTFHDQNKAHCVDTCPSGSYFDDIEDNCIECTNDSMCLKKVQPKTISEEKQMKGKIGCLGT